MGAKRLTKSEIALMLVEYGEGNRIYEAEQFLKLWKKIAKKEGLKTEW